MLAGEGDDYRKLPLFLRKQNLAQLLARRPEGIHAAPFEQGEITGAMGATPGAGAGGTP